MKSPRTVLIVTAIAASLIALAYLFWNGSANKEPETPTAIVERGNLEVVIAAAGRLTPRDTVEVGAQVSGQLLSLAVEAGDSVEEGQLLAQIDATIAENKVSADRAQLKESRASYDQQSARVELAAANLKRAKLLREKDAISEADIDSATAELKVAKANLAQIEAQIERQESTLKSDLAELDYTKIYAPMTGTVTSLAASEGQTLNANQTAPKILTISDLSVMTVEADVSEADVLRVTPGQSAYFTILGDAETRWRAKVRQVLPEPEVVNDVVLYKALLDVDNKDFVLRPEMTAQIFFIVGEARNALLVPLSALQSSGSARASRAGRDSENANKATATRTVLVVEKSGTVSPRQVEVGLQTRAQAEIVSGLEEGDVVQLKTSAQSSSTGSASSQRSSMMRPRF